MNGLIISTISKVFIFVVKNDKFNYFCLEEADTNKSSEKLLPLIKKALIAHDLKLTDLNFIAVCNGVGSFTGVRVGLATAKIMAQVACKNLVVFNNFEVLASSADGSCESNLVKSADGSFESVFACPAYAGGLFVSENNAIQYFNKLQKEELFNSNKKIIVADFEAEYFENSNFTAIDYLGSAKKLVLEKLSRNELTDFEKVDAVYVVNSQAEVELDLAMKNVKVLLASEADLQELEQIEKECFTENVYSLNMFKEELISENKKYFKVVFKDKIVGFAGFSFIENELELLKIAILPLHRGKGLAKILFNKAIETFSFDKIFLEVNKNNLIAISLYEGLGFKQISQRKNYYSNGDDALIFEFIK